MTTNVCIAGKVMSVYQTQHLGLREVAENEKQSQQNFYGSILKLKTRFIFKSKLFIP